MKRSHWLAVMILLALVMSSPVILAEVDYSEWVGERVVFLPMLPSLQTFGYQMYSFTSREALRDPAKYEELAGRYATITSISEEFGTLRATFLLDDGRTVYGSGYGGYFEDIAFVSELENAKQYVGRAVWHKTSNGRNFIENYDWSAARWNRVPISNLERFTVVDVKWWVAGFSPLEFILRRENGELISWYGSYSRLNMPTSLSKPFAENWFLADPKGLYPDWPEAVWDLIKDFRIAIGMTKDQVLLSWGQPKRVNRTILASGTYEQWVYGDTGPYVYFESGIVTAIQD